jgi:hypothetical protein
MINKEGGQGEVRGEGLEGGILSLRVSLGEWIGERVRVRAQRKVPASGISRDARRLINDSASELGKESRCGNVSA